MPIASELQNLLHSGTNRMGELEFQAGVYGCAYLLCHWQDAARSCEPAFGGLERHEGPAAARNLSIYTAEGHYRFSKGQRNLKRGWVMMLENEEQLRQALDHFYPAGVGMFLALRNGTLETENLRAKLERQSGMFRVARNVSDAGVQRLVREVCGPTHQCAKRILWQIDAGTPLEESEASRFNGIANGVPESTAIPLLCREACNHFVGECRRVAKEEAVAQPAAS
jgi:hypothetical protein